MTPLDQAHAAMEDADDETARLRFFETLATSEVFVLLEAEGSDTPRVFSTEDGAFLLIFDREDRLATFAEGPAPYAALSGRALAETVAGQGVGLGVNLGVAPSSILLPPEALDWLAETLSARPDEASATPVEVAPPGALPEGLLTGLDARLAAAEGFAKAAYLAAVTYADGRKGHLLAIVGAPEDAHGALAQSVSDALALSGVEAAALDVMFATEGDAVVEKLERVGLRFDVPEPVVAAPPVPDPTKPPKLR